MVTIPSQPSSISICSCDSVGMAHCIGELSSSTGPGSCIPLKLISDDSCESPRCWNTWTLMVIRPYTAKLTYHWQMIGIVCHGRNCLDMLWTIFQWQLWWHTSITLFSVLNCLLLKRWEQVEFICRMSQYLHLWLFHEFLEIYNISLMRQK